MESLIYNDEALLYVNVINRSIEFYLDFVTVLFVEWAIFSVIVFSTCFVFEFMLEKFFDPELFYSVADGGV